MGEKYPQVADMKSSEIFVESVNVFTGGKRTNISICRIINKSDQKGMIQALRSQLATDEVYLVTISK